jgi:hypothetical protein
MLKELKGSRFLRNKTICPDILWNGLYNILIDDTIIVDEIYCSELLLLTEEVVDFPIFPEKMILEECWTPSREFSTGAGTVTTQVPVHLKWFHPLVEDIFHFRDKPMRRRVRRYLLFILKVLA